MPLEHLAMCTMGMGTIVAPVRLLRHLKTATKEDGREQERAKQPDHQPAFGPPATPSFAGFSVPAQAEHVQQEIVQGAALPHHDSSIWDRNLDHAEGHAATFPILRPRPQSSPDKLEILDLLGCR